MTNSIYDFFESSFTKFKTTLKETSYDQVNDEYTTELEIDAYNYDHIIKFYFINSNCLSCSQDAIIISENEILFVEFKNTTLAQKITSDDKSMLRRYKLKFNDDIKNKLLLKGVEGLYVFKKILQENSISLDGITLKYILCYNENKNFRKDEDYHINKIMGGLRILSHYRNVGFGLYRLKHDIYYDEVLTLGRNEFKHYMQELGCI